ncbi:MAG: glutathione peroxidase [Actinomycetota bacterium]|nr:glutathione peroxidase [Actinomycetota bacterium]
MNVHDFEADSIDGEPVKLADYAGKVVLVVNVASKCGLTPQYEALEALYRRHREQGLEILGFPCDQFGNQEPGTEAEIAEFCSTTYGVSFPMFSKVEVNGDEAHPLYKHLRAADHGAPMETLPGGEHFAGMLEGHFPELFEDPEAIKWNFTKFLVSRDGEVVKRFQPNETPEAIEPELTSALGS